MDPCRIRSYLQVACAGLGFEIGEIWWTANEHGSSTVAAIEDNGALVKGGGGKGRGGGEKHLRFVQLYTSKSYANRRDQLVTPPEEEKDDRINDSSLMPHNNHHEHECTKDDLEKHKLSPRLVDAISKTAQVVWANTLKQEGLTGRSDIPLHTAVGMPVALDADGNMCIVVMFSPNNIQSTDEAMEYLQSISKSATSSSIPCLMPAFDRTEDIQHVPTSSKKNNAIRGHIMPEETSLGEGVTARFVSIDDDQNASSSTAEHASGHDLASAPKDCFGIPMLPCFAELGRGATAAPAPALPAPNQSKTSTTEPALEDVFDEASFGVWSTIMQDRPPIVPSSSPSPAPSITEENLTEMAVENGIPVGLNEGINPAEDDAMVDPKSLVTTNKRAMDRMRKERLEEFCSAFLGMSVFDIADVWIPAGPEHPDCLSHVVSISSSNQSNPVTDFKRVSGYTLIKYWSGAVGRAYSSGNPVWSCNPDVYIDKGRAQVFERANIMTAFAVPIFSEKKKIPAGVVCCYSMIQSGSVPFVLRFVQQALHLLWSGLDKVQPHKSVGQQMWQDVGPADLGEMAADVEMQHHFMSKKRPRHLLSSEHLSHTQQLAPHPPTAPDHSAPLSAHLKTINFHREETAPTFSTVPQIEVADPIPEFYNFQQMQTQHQKPPEQRVSVQAMQAFQNHIKDAVRQVGEALPFTHTHIATTADGRKRAHVTHHHHHQAQPTVTHLQPPQPRKHVQPAPLAMPHALPTQVVRSVHYGQTAEHTTKANMPKLAPITTNLAGGAPAPAVIPAQVAPPPMSYAPPPVRPHPSPAPPPQTYMQSPAQALPTQVAPPAPAPSKLSQNLLSQGMLESIACQQYQFAYEPAPAPAASGATPMQYTAPIAPTSVGVATPAAAMPVQQKPSQSNGYCMPTSSGYLAPDTASSGTGITTVASAKAKLCRIQGCGDAAVIRRPYCARHSGNRLCEHEGCTKCAQGSTRFCIAHGGGRRCTFPGCDKGARDKFFCAAHGGGKRCKAEGCNKSAVGGSSLCTAHGGGRRCAIEGCDKSAQSSTKFCVKHGGGKKCSHEGCEKVARGRTQFCAAHGGGVRCKLEGCNRVAIGKMQLCRAHGGGSRAKNKAKVPQAPPPVAPLYGTAPIQSVPMQTIPMPTLPTVEYPTRTSV